MLLQANHGVSSAVEIDPCAYVSASRMPAGSASTQINAGIPSVSTERPARIRAWRVKDIPLRTR